jgi:hypothetical protein
MTSNEVEKMDRDDALDSPTCPLTNPVMDQSELEGRPAMGHAGHPWLPLPPNSGFDSRDRGQSCGGQVEDGSG